MPEKMTHLSLFTGIGGLDLAAERAGFTTVGQCEWADYPSKVLEKHWPDVPRWRDICTLTKESFYENAKIRCPTVVSGGFPCQPHSVAGKHLGADDERDLWPEVVRVLREIKPRWFVGENVRGLLSTDNGRFFGRVLRDLAQMGYRVWWLCFPAHAVGTPFWGERVAIVAASNGVRWFCLDQNQKKRYEDVNLEIYAERPHRSVNLPFYVAWPQPKPIGGLLRNDDGIPDALDRLKCLGNAVIPQQFYPIFAAIAEIERTADI